MEQLLDQNKALLSQLEKLMTQLTQIQLFQSSQFKKPNPPIEENESTLEPDKIICDLDAALAVAPSAADNDPFSPQTNEVSS